MRCGVYQIKSLFDNKLYVGCSNDIAQRWRHHRSQLRRGVHYNNHLQNAWNKYGSDNFEFSILEITTEDNILVREQHWIDVLNVVDEGYNISAVAERRAGHSWSEESRAKMRGNTHTLGLRHTEESKALMSASRLGVKKPESSRENYRNAALIREYEKRKDAPDYVEPEWLKSWRLSK